MNKIFLAFSFRPENDRLVRDIDRVIRSYGLVPVTGEILGGQGLSQEVQARIRQCDALVALFTRELQIQGQDGQAAWLPTQWVSDEYASARARNQLAIAIVEDGVQTNGAFAQHERINLSRPAAPETFIRLSETLGYWRAEAGRSLEIRLLPQEAATFASSENARCEYRLVPPDGGAPSEWTKARPARKPGGVFVIVQGVKTDQSIEVKLLEGIIQDGLLWNLRNGFILNLRACNDDADCTGRETGEYDALALVRLARCIRGRTRRCRRGGLETSSQLLAA